MADVRPPAPLSRRDFLELAAAGLTALVAGPFSGKAAAAPLAKSPVYWVDRIPNQPFVYPRHPNRHAGVEALLRLQARNGLPFYRSASISTLGGPDGLIASNDIVLVKVNAQWKHRGCTNSDVVRGLVQRVLDHPDGFRGEVVIMENGQGRGSLSCDRPYFDGDTLVRANANNRLHTFRHLVDSVFKDRRVSGRLLDPVRAVFLDGDDHENDGYRLYQTVSYPCFTSDGGNRIELREGLWTGQKHVPRLKLINIPVLKHHDQGGSEITAAVKHVYGILSMADGNFRIRHYEKLGASCGRMIVSVRPPVLNIIDAIWVSYASCKGYPPSTTFRANTLVSGQDPVALDAWTARHVLYPIDGNPRHLPSFAGVRAWLEQARDLINARGGLYDPAMGLKVGPVRTSEAAMSVFHASAG